MGYNHGCQCGARLESTCVTVADGIMTVMVVPTQTYVGYKFYGFDLCLALPAHTGVEPVAIADELGTYPLIDTNGQPVVSGQLRGHKRYRVRYGPGGTLSSGAIDPHFTVYDGLCRMEYSANAALQEV